MNADTGKTEWTVERLAIGNLDYGNSPRATPCIDDKFVYLMGALGTLLCVDVRTGDVIWERNFSTEFTLPGELPWGYCGSPLLLKDRLIVAAGAAKASILALDPQTGRTLWAAPGALPSYGSLVSSEIGGRTQILGHDADSLGGWDARTGQRLWKIQPQVTGDFNVPTPLILDGRLLVTTENNGTRVYGFDEGGLPKSEPWAHNRNLKPDMSSPVAVRDRLFCVDRFLYCFDTRDGLTELWRMRDSALSEYSSVIASEDRLLVVGDGELIMMPADGTQKVISRQRIFPEKLPVYSHPALWDGRLYIRGESSVVCVQLESD